MTIVNNSIHSYGDSNAMKAYYTDLLSRAASGDVEPLRTEIWALAAENKLLKARYESDIHIDRLLKIAYTHFGLPRNVAIETLIALS